MQQLVFFIEPNDKNSTALNLYMNRFIIDEDASHEIVQIYEIEKFRQIITGQKCSVDNKEQIGMVHIIYFLIFQYFVVHTVNDSPG